MHNKNEPQANQRRHSGRLVTAKPDWLQTHNFGVGRLTELSKEQQNIKKYFISERGYWRSWNEFLLQHNPEFLKNYATYAGYPARKGPLSPRMVELIYIALDASATHLFPNGLATHLELAFKSGATTDDVMDVFVILATQGVGIVHQATDLLNNIYGIQEMDPNYIDTVERLNTTQKTQGLTDDERLIINIALHACFTGFNSRQLQLHLQQAKQQQVPYAAVLQAIQLGAHLSVHGTALGVQALEQKIGLNE